VEGDRRAGAERPQDRQALVHAPPARARIDAADLELVAILAAQPDTEGQPPGRQLGDRRQLARDRHRMAQRQEVEGHVDPNAGVRGQQRRGRHHAVRAYADEEADVIADADVVDVRRRNVLEPCLPLRRPTGEVAGNREGAHAHVAHGCTFSDPGPRRHGPWARRRSRLEGA
jgi:hypothetical protein